MPLIKSISGIRGTIGGTPGEGLNPIDIARFTSAYSQWLKERNGNAQPKVVVGRDARISGEMVNSIVVGTLMGCGVNVIDIGLATTPTVEIAVTQTGAQGGIIITASHNPRQWNALKLLNETGEFLNDAEGKRVLEMADGQELVFPEVDALGALTVDDSFTDRHIDLILGLPMVNKQAIAHADFRIAIDCVNSVGGIALPRLLKALGVKEIYELYTQPNGEFPHNPEPLPEHLTEISAAVVRHKAHLGFVVDPDVDRLAIVNEDGSMFGEEYTLVTVADYILRHRPGNTVSNLSSTAALREVTKKFGGAHYASAVGEVNVVAKMKQCRAVVGGEGNGGVIYPDLHFGRDALVGIALFLSHLALAGMKCSELRATYPEFFISKNKIDLKPDTDLDALFARLKEAYSTENLNTEDGLRIDKGDGDWVHLRQSNTEPIVRVYAESTSPERADALAQVIMMQIKNIANMG